MAGVLAQPVVVGSKTGALELGVLQPKEAETERRVNHLALNAVNILVLQAFGGIPSARQGVRVALALFAVGHTGALAGGAESNADAVRWKALVQPDILHSAVQVPPLQSRGAELELLIDS